MSKFVNVWTFSDLNDRQADVIAAAKSFGATVNTFVFGADRAANAFAMGADKVFDLGTPADGVIVEDYCDTMAKAINEGAKPALVVMPASVRAKAIAGKLGAMLNAGVVNDVSEFGADDSLSHLVYGGLAVSNEKVMSDVTIVTIGGGLFAALPADASRTGEVVTLDFVAPAVSGIRRLGVTAKAVGGVDLSRAKRVIGVGRGFSKQEDLKLADDLAAAIGAEVGCSRPIAEGEQWMERERYIGVSGVMLKPDFYMAVGISGQIQHMVGVNRANVVFAINKDKKAPVFKYADFGLVGDLQKVLPKLTAALK